MGRRGGGRGSPRWVGWLSSDPVLVMTRKPRAALGGNGAGAGGAGLVGRTSRGRIGELQRARILTAMVELVRERGVGSVTVAHVVARSGVSRRTFYELFEDREACFLAAFEQAVARIAERVVPVYAAGGVVWRERVRAGLGALLELIDEEPATGVLCVVDALAGGPVVLERRAGVARALVDVVHEGRLEARVGRRPRRLVAEGVVGAVLSVIHDRLLERDPGPLVRLLNPLMAIVVLPYLGSQAAEGELAFRSPRRRRPARASGRRDGAGDPLRGLDMRLTYRTVRVLLAVAELGGRESMGGASNNRQVADASGVADQGQMSKLLRRLEHLGLIANDMPRPGRGEPNAWTLTARGREVERAIRAQAPH
jgi:AcrR family transcriptional regulator